jgi:DNA recombination protein RmuC
MNMAIGVASIGGLFTGMLVMYLICRAAATARVEREVGKRLDPMRAAEAQLRTELEASRMETRKTQEAAADVDQRSGQRIAQQEDELAKLRERLTALTTDEATHRAKVEELEALQQQLQNVFASLSAKALQTNNETFLQLARSELEKVRTEAQGDIQKSGKAIEELLAPIRDGLKAYDEKIDLIEKERLHTAGELTQRLQQVGEASAALKGETQNLVDALRSPTVRGLWGEVQLKRVCEMAGMLEYCDFDTQPSVDTDNGRLRPDLVVRLAAGRNIVVDAKTPNAAYMDALSAPDEQTRRDFLRKHAEQIRAHVVDLSRKAYWEQFSPAPGFVVLFLPREVFFSAALQQDPALIEFGVEHNVILATPTTLIAMLRTAALGWQQESISRNAEEISRLAKELYERLATLGGHFENMGRHLKNAVDAYNRGIGSLESRVLVTARKLHAQGVFPSDEIAVFSPVELSTRALQAPEYLPTADGSTNGSTPTE